MINTEICELLGIRYPIFQGGMAWVADAALAAAVSNAGGLGIIAAMNMNGEQLRAEIGRLREVCDKPFGVNVPQAAADAIAHHGMAQLRTDREPDPVFSRAAAAAVEHQVAVGGGAPLVIQAAKQVTLFQRFGKLHPDLR